MLELMHSYEEIKLAYQKASIVDKYEMGERLDKDLHPKPGSEDSLSLQGSEAS